jgi:hypothetical protein
VVDGKKIKCNIHVTGSEGPKGCDFLENRLTDGGKPYAPAAL